MAVWPHFAARVQGGRPYQEDEYGIAALPARLRAGNLLLVLADGMGGGQAGDRASALAVRSFIEAYGAAAAQTTIPERLEWALEQASRALALAIAADLGTLAGMGCTLLAVVLANHRLYWISVGDSPLWLWRGGVLRRLNEDHSYRRVLAQQVAAGQISPFEASYHPDRNALLSALTGEPPLLVDLCAEPYRLQRGDRILLASDGLLTLSEDQITTQLRSCSNARSAGQRLLDAVLAADYPYQDNVTVLLVQVPERRFFRRGLGIALLLALLTALGAGGLWWEQLGEPWTRAITAASLAPPAEKAP